jgi:uncharacterized protein YceH (UPF0502 family)
MRAMTPDVQLDPHEARALGVLIEKELATPDQYPLTLNAVTNGANQKNNRDPVLDLSEHEVEAALRKMIVKGLVGSVHPLGSRVEKFRHNAQTIFSIEKPQLAVFAELLVRGPQQPGELRGRASRMVAIESLAALTEILGPMLGTGLVARLDPTPGSRAERYAHTLSGHFAAVPAPAVHAPAAHVAAPLPSAPPAEPASVEDRSSMEKRVAELEFSVSRIRRQLDNLAWKLGEKLEG